MGAIRCVMPFRASPPTRRAILALTAAALADPWTALAAPDDRAEQRGFRDEVVAILRSDFPKVEFVLDDADPEQIRIGSFSLYLGNLRRTLVDQRGAARRSEIVKIVSPLATGTLKPSTPAEAFAQASRRLRIQLVPTEYREQVPELICRRFSDKLLVAYALDEPERYQMVTKPLFEAWGVPQADIERIAQSNLNQASGGLQVQISPTGRKGHFATLESPDGYAAARLLLPTVMDQVREGLKTPVMVVAVPTRDILLAWSHDSEARFTLARLVTKLLREGPYGRSAELFRSSTEELRLLNPAELVGYRR